MAMKGPAGLRGRTPSWVHEFCEEDWEKLGNNAKLLNWERVVLIIAHNFTSPLGSDEASK